MAESDTLAAPLALLVPDGALYVEVSMQGGQATYDVLWEGTIFYPSNVQFVFEVPTIWQLPALRPYTHIKEPFPMLLSEAVFCGMHVDGEMNPYRQHWKAKIAVDDPRLSEEQRSQAVLTWFEKLIK